MGEVQVNKAEERKSRRQFDEAFKRDAVRLVETGNSSVRQVAEDLGISKATLSNWVDKARKERREVGGDPGSRGREPQVSQRERAAQNGEGNPKTIFVLLGERDRRELIYQFIDIQKADFPVSTFYRVCGASRSAYYHWNTEGRGVYETACRARQALKNHAPSSSCAGST